MISKIPSEKRGIMISKFCKRDIEIHIMITKLTSHDTIECPVYSCRDTVDIQEFLKHGNCKIFLKVKVDYDETSQNGISYVPKYMLIQKYVLFWKHLNFREP